MCHYLFKTRGVLTRYFALTRQCNVVLLVSYKKVTEWLCDWLETSSWGFNSFLSRFIIYCDVVLEQMQVLQMCGKGVGIREVIQRWLRLGALKVLHVLLRKLLK